ncbi:hypothetical protein Pfo_011925 [Paulownia fortunei]|nr:hypothetical protein Pfo_011925 [Paulownia fortunei]
MLINSHHHIHSRYYSHRSRFLKPPNLPYSLLLPYIQSHLAPPPQPPHTLTGEGGKNIVNPISSWICTNSSKNLFVTIVHPDGHVEIHDRPIQAAELLNRNPKCCVAHPTVFQQPYAIVSPTTTLSLGQKYYIVPIGTIRKLQLKYSPSQSQQANIKPNDHKQKTGKKDGDRKEMESSCWLMRNNKNGQKVKNVSSRKRSNKNSAGVGNGGTRVSLTSFHHWQPGLESITEE